MFGSLRGVPISVQPVPLAPKLPTEVRQYRYEISPLDAQVLTGLSLAAAPSGSGELAISGLIFASGVVTFVLSGGQPTRGYTLLLTATRSDSLVSDYLFTITVDSVLVTDQAQVAPSTLFGDCIDMDTVTQGIAMPEAVLVVSILALAVTISIALTKGANFVFEGAADAKNTAAAVARLELRLDKVFDKMEALPRASDLGAMAVRTDGLEARVAALELIRRPDA